MAYRNLVAQACTSKNEFYCRFRDFLCSRNGTYADYTATGMGWTLHDAVYAVDEDNCQINDYFVVHSPGEGGNDDIYIRVLWVSASFNFLGYVSWNPTTHAGSTSYRYNTSGVGINIAQTDVSISAYIYGDLDQFIIMHDNTATDYYIATCGRLHPMYSNLSADITTCSGYISAGTDVSITVAAAPSTWYVGTDLFIRTTHTNDIATVRLEKTRIKTIIGNDITVDLTNSFTSNSKLSEMVGYYAHGGVNFMSTLYHLVDNDGALNQNAAFVFNDTVVVSSVNPDYLSDQIALYPLHAINPKGLFGMLKNLYYTPIHNAEFTHLDVLATDEGTEYRCFKVTTTKYIAIKEV